MGILNRKQKLEKELTSKTFALFFSELFLIMQNPDFSCEFIKRIPCYKPLEIEGMLKFKCNGLNYYTGSHSEDEKVKTIVRDCVANFDIYMKEYIKIKYNNRTIKVQ